MEGEWNWVLSKGGSGPSSGSWCKRELVLRLGKGQTKKQVWTWYSKSKARIWRGGLAVLNWQEDEAGRMSSGRSQRKIYIGRNFYGWNRQNCVESAWGLWVALGKPEWLPKRMRWLLWDASQGGGGRQSLFAFMDTPPQHTHPNQALFFSIPWGISSCSLWSQSLGRSLWLCVHPWVGALCW